MGKRRHCEGRGLYFLLKKTPIENKKFVRHRIISVVKKVEFVCDRMSCIVFRGYRCNIFFLKECAPTEVKSDVLKYSFCEKLKQIFEDFPKYRTNILSEFNAKFGRADIFKQTIGFKSLHQDSNDNGVRIVNFAP